MDVVDDRLLLLLLLRENRRRLLLDVDEVLFAIGALLLRRISPLAERIGVTTLTISSSFAISSPFILFSEERLLIFEEEQQLLPLLSDLQSKP